MPANAEDDKPISQVEKIEGIKVTDEGKWYYVKWKGHDERCMNTWEPESKLRRPDILLDFHAKIAAELEEPLFLPKQPIKQPAQVEQKEEVDDLDKLDDIPLLLRSEKRKRIGTDSPQFEAGRLPAPAKSSHPAKRHAPERDISTEKEDSNTQVWKPNDVDGPNGLANSVATPPILHRVKPSNASQELNKAAQTGTELLPSDTDKCITSPVNRTASLPIIPHIANNKNAGDSVDKALTQVVDYSNLIPASTAAEADNKATENAAEAMQLQLALAATPHRVGLDMPSPSSNDTTSFNSLMELISRNSNKSQSGNSNHRRSRTSSNGSLVNQASSSTTSASSARTVNGGRVKRRQRSESDGSTSVWSSASKDATLHVGKHVDPTAITKLPNLSLVWRGNMKWGDYTLQDVTVKPIRDSVVVDEIRSTMAHRPVSSITSFFSQQHLADYIRTPPEIFSISFPTDSVPYGKLRNFLSINNVVGLVPISLRYSFAVVPYTFPVVAKEAIDPSLKQSLFLIHISLPSVYPAVPVYLVDPHRGNNFSVTSIYEWHITMRMYSVPLQVMTVPLEKSILIVDDHPDASKVWYAAQTYGYKMTSKPNDPSLHTVLIHYRDFPNVAIPHLEDMKRPGVHFLLYGYADLKMSRGADEEVFPEQSGGYVTTAADELIRRPELLKEMILDVEKLNAFMNSSITTQWQLIFPDDIFDQITRAGQKSDQTERADAARWELITALEEDKVSILSRIMKVHNKNTTQWMDRVAQAFASSRRYFVQVSSEKLEDPSHRVSVVDPQALFSRFKPMTSFGATL